MEIDVKKILSIKDDLQSHLIISGFNLDLEPKDSGLKSIKSSLNELNFLLRSTFLYFNKKSFTLSVFFSSAEIDKIESLLIIITDILQDSLDQLRDIEGNPLIQNEEVQVDGNIFDFPNLNASNRERQVKPRDTLRLSELDGQVDLLKPYLRPFAYKGAEGRGDAYKKVVNDQIALENIKNDYINILEYAKRMNHDISNALADANLKRSEIDTIHNNFEAKYEEIDVDIDKMNKKTAQFAAAKDEWDEKIQEMESLKLESESIIVRMSDLFNDSNETRKELKRLVTVARDTSDESSQAKDKFDQQIANAEELTEKAKAVLNLSGTVSIGQFFKEQYEEALKHTKGWLIACAILLIAAVGVCVWALWNYHDLKESVYLISRLSIVPLILGGLWFCSSQYIKQKNIIEDYAYKKVLALSMVSFRNEISDSSPEGVSDYIKAVLAQLHQPPLDSLEKSHFRNEAKLLKGVQTEIFKDILLGLSAKGKEMAKDDKKTSSSEDKEDIENKK